MLGKFDSLRDSALHYLCSVEWGNESFGDVSTYGVYIWRISISSEELEEVASALEALEESEELLRGIEDLEAFHKSLVGHFMVSENEQGLVTVKEYTLESELIRHFNSMQEHFNEFMSTQEDA